MNITPFSYLMIIFAAICPSIGVMAANAFEAGIFDLESAMQYCHETELEGPEGIWEFVEDETIVLIKKENRGGKDYDIIIVSTPDCRLKPGERIGSLQRSAKRGKYKMNLFVSRNMGTFTDSRICLAEYIDKEDAMHVQPMKLKISVRTMWFLPKFWRSLRISFDNPAADLPRGLLKVYPRNEPSKPIYL